MTIDRPAAGGSLELVPLGLYTLTIDTGVLTGYLEPAAMRAGTTPGDDLLVDASPYFGGGAGGAAVTVRRVMRSADGTYLADIAIRHPFPLPDPANPRPEDRYDLHLTDVALVCLLEGPAVDLGPGLPRVVPDAVLNADGYTDLLAGSFALAAPTDAGAHPFRILSLDGRAPNYDPASPTGWTDLRDPRGFNVFPQGRGWWPPEEFASPFELRLGPGIHRMHMAIQAAYHHPGGAPGSRLSPIYTLPEGNLKAAFRVATEFFNDALTAGDGLSATEVDVLINDWQHGATVAGGAWSPAANKGELRSASAVSRVILTVPGLGWIGEADLSNAAGDGSFAQPLRATARITNDAMAGAGNYWGLIQVLDNRTGGTAVWRDGSTPGIDHHRTYQVFRVTVRPEDPMRIKHITLGTANGYFVAAGETLTPTVLVHRRDGTHEPIDGAVFTNPRPDLVAIDGPSVTRLLPRDQSDRVVLPAVLDLGPAGKFRARGTLVLGDPYADTVVNYSPSCGASAVGANPSLALHGPRGGGAAGGNTTHVTSLGYSGSITLRFTDGLALDKPGPDFIVFENAFEIAQSPDEIFTETVRVEVSEQGTDWRAFPMDYEPMGPTPWRNPANFSGLAGVHPVLANIVENGIDPQDPPAAGGDAFDLADVGLEFAQYVRLTATGIDATSPCFPGCPTDTRMRDTDGDLIDDEGKRAPTCSSFVGGPDIDAVAIVAGHQGLAE
ncbi:MAG TPA: hypothetical protein VEI97_00595 [bacterium]|nr:hypothetical protein [bacterium]